MSETSKNVGMEDLELANEQMVRTQATLCFLALTWGSQFSKKKMCSMFGVSRIYYFDRALSNARSLTPVLFVGFGAEIFKESRCKPLAAV